ncbi:SDR family NAD(P)-dependent oxidoreductase [Enterobacter sp. C2]|uniref:SDR family NAD(P)-dependent oxidoreductase n=1 Tax=Enterobacter sp. C2 TaxID=2870346 RepID=UPI001CA394FD|nr:SDR family NAD(P)-dependent oxidoreductase [Enterobacter sp. C2]
MWKTSLKMVTESSKLMTDPSFFPWLITTASRSVIGTARDLNKAEAAVSGIRSAGGSLKLLQLDLASLSSIRAAAVDLLNTGLNFDIVIANAGVMATPEGKTEDGFEMQFGTNAIGHFVLINRISPLLHSGSRIILLSSAAHAVADVNLDDINFEKSSYDPWIAYGRSKTAVAQLAVEFERRLASKGIHATAVHPGAIQTELQRHYGKELDDAIIQKTNEANARRGLPPFQWKTVQQGAATTVWCAAVAQEEEIGGKFCEDCHVTEINDSEGVTNGVRSYVFDKKKTEALWTKIEELVHEKF